jgi:hypothetical protein
MVSITAAVRPVMLQRGAAESRIGSVKCRKDRGEKKMNGQEDEKAEAKRISGWCSLLVRMRMRMNLWMSHVLRSVVIRRVHERLDARYPLLLRGVDVRVCGVMSFGHTGQHVRRARLFIEVRNANTAVFERPE